MSAKIIATLCFFSENETLRIFVKFVTCAIIKKDLLSCLCRCWFL